MDYSLQYKVEFNFFAIWTVKSFFIPMHLPGERSNVYKTKETTPGKQWEKVYNV
jgi:hypothetical protein